ncbi:MAG: aminodeoxychorismate lyase [Arenimonas sp.]|nr:aminodeoxychorismate lyase [Arenimonas sp.]
MKALIFRGNSPIEQLSPLDRGLAYGDGVFETILAVNGELIWWNEHWQRLKAAAQRLSIELPNVQLIQNSALQLAGLKRCVVKIILTRGEGGRGYAATDGPSTTIIKVHAAPEILQSAVSVGWCKTQISQQPALAGMKHLNRLENVLARSEFQPNTFFDGLMCDMSGAVICATSANLFVYTNHCWRTPDLSASGINGLARQWLLDHCENISIERMPRATVENAEAIFICNSVRGMMAVNRINNIDLPTNSAFTDLHKQFMLSNPAFSTE